MKHKSKQMTGVQVKDESQGSVEAIFSTFNVIDSDRDVTRPGAFEEGAKVRISAYNHSSWGTALPVGKGVIRQTEEAAILDGQFFLDTATGKDTFAVVKNMEDLQEWSYGYDILKASDGTFEGESVQFLESLKVHEVSPVILGAGVGTQTLSAKGKQLNSQLMSLLCEAGKERWETWDNDQPSTYVYLDDFDPDESWAVFYVQAEGEPETCIQVDYTRTDDAVTLGDEEREVQRVTEFVPKGDSSRFTKHLGLVLTRVDEVAARAADVMALRAEKGKGLGKESKDLLERLESSLQGVHDVLDPQPDPDETSVELEPAEIARAQRHLMR